MKQITCSNLGGPADCNVVITGNDAQDMIDKGWKHLQEAHPDLVKNIMSNSKEANDKWMDDFKANFDNLKDA